jgi:mRNA interferase RelE/StbE
MRQYLPQNCVNPLAYKVSYKSSVKKDLKKISRTEQTSILSRIEKILTTKPASFPQLSGEFKGLRKFRIGKYRVIYSLTGEDILVLKIGHRKEVYR